MTTAIEDDWLAIKDFSSGNLFTNSSSQNQFQVEWIDSDRTLLLKSKDKLRSSEAETSNEVVFTIEALIAIDLQVKELNPDIDIGLPELPKEAKGIWGYLSSSIMPDNLEENILTYFNNMQVMLGKQLFMQIYFDTFTEIEYLENMDELNRESLLQEVHCAKELLDEALNLRHGSINFVDLCSLYSVEDEALLKLETAEACLYNFERQPFIELREIARSKYGQLVKELKSTKEDFEKLQLSEECIKRKKELKENEVCLIKLQLNYFEKCISCLEKSCDLLIEDKQSYKYEFKDSIGSERLSMKEKELSQLKLQLLQLKRKETQLKLEDIKEKVCLLDDSNDIEQELKILERKFYKTEMNLFEFRFQIISEKEKNKRFLLKDLTSSADDDNSNNDNNNNEFNIIRNSFVGETDLESVNCDKDNTDQNLENKNIDIESADQNINETYENTDDEENDTFYDCDDKTDQIFDYNTDQKTKTTNQFPMNENFTGNETKQKHGNIVNEFLESVFPIENSQQNVWEKRKQVKVVIANSERYSDEYEKKKEIIQSINKLYRKRAWLRLKQNKFSSEWKEKFDYKKRAAEEYKKHHSIQMKRDKQKQELAEKREFLQAERRKTVERLKEFKSKNPNSTVRYPSRYTIAVRRTRNQPQNIPFRPGGPSILQKGTAASLRIDSARDKAEKSVKTSPVKIKSKKVENSKDISTDVDKEELKSQEYDVVNSNNIAPSYGQQSQPPPPPPLPPPPVARPPVAPPLPPSLPLLFNLKNKNSNDKPLGNFPLPPKREMKEREISSKSSSGIDLSSIIQGRQMLKKAEVNKDRENHGITDVTANMLQNALNKMKKYTMDSSDEEMEEEEGMFEENIFE